MQKKGFTLIELVVAITLFVIVVTLAIGGFVAISKTKTKMNDMKETQQKVRLVSEMITRFAKEADDITLPDPTVTGAGYHIRMFYHDSNGNFTSEKVFAFGTATGANSNIYTQLKYYNCNYEESPAVFSPDANGDVAGCVTEDLLSSSLGTSYQIQKTTVDASFQDIFKLKYTIPATLSVNMIFVDVNNTPGSASNDEYVYSNRILLEALK